MTKRKTNHSCYQVITERGIYAVLVRHLKNDVYGHPRFECDITTLKINGERETQGYYYSVCYSFTGHYMDAENECKWIVNYHENELKKNRVY